MTVVFLTLAVLAQGGGVKYCRCYCHCYGDDNDDDDDDDDDPNEDDDNDDDGDDDDDVDGVGDHKGKARTSHSRCLPFCGLGVADFLLHYQISGYWRALRSSHSRHGFSFSRALCNMELV